MADHDQVQTARRVAARVLRFVPASACAWAASSRLAVLAKLGRAGLQDRRVRVRRGAATGCTMNVGWGDTAMCLGTYETEVQRRLSREVRRGDVVFDIGSHVGFFALIAARSVGPTGVVVAFEPHPTNLELLRGNLEANRVSNVRVVDAAVGATSGTVELHIAGVAARHRVGEAGESSESIDVRMVTIDDLVDRGACPPPTLVKLDVEGHELAALVGMAAVLDRHRPKVLVEIDGADRDELEANMDEIRRLLEPLGYRGTTLPDSYRHIDAEVDHVLFTVRPSIEGEGDEWTTSRAGSVS